MRINSKSIITLLIAFLMIFGTAFYSFAQPNTQIHLKTGSFSQLSTATIICYIKGHYGTPEQNITIGGINATKLPMTTKGGSGQFVTQDLNLTADPEIIYFTIGGIEYYVGQQILRIGKEGGGTINYEVKSLPKYTLTYDGNGSTGGTVPAPSTQYKADTNVVVLGNIGNFVKTNHTFTGWRTTPDISGTAYVANSTLKMPFANVTLYAQWSKNLPYTVTYEHGGADDNYQVVPIDNTEYYTGDKVEVRANTEQLKKENYHFVGWKYDDFIYPVGANVPVGTKDIIFTAIWAPNEVQEEFFTVTYHENLGGSITIKHLVDGNEGNKTDQIIKDSSINLYSEPVEFAKPADKNFIGWSSSSTGGVQAEPGQLVIVDAHKNYYAVWENKLSYKVFYNGNGNTAGSAPVDGTAYYSNQEASVLVVAPEFKKLNHTLLGWSTSQAATTAEYTDVSKITITDHDVYLFAVWKQDEKYSVSYDANGGTGAVPVDEDSYFMNSKASALNGSNLVMTNHKIVGWKIESDPKVYKPGDEFTITGKMKLTAVWEYIPPQETNPPTTNPPQETNSPATEPPTTQPSTTEPTTVATTEEEVVIETEGTPEGAATVEETEEITDPIIPLSVLPQTGQLPVELFYGVGGLITAAGVYLRRKSS